MIKCNSINVQIAIHAESKDILPKKSQEALKAAKLNGHNGKQILSIVRIRGITIADLLPDYNEEEISRIGNEYYDEVKKIAQIYNGFVYQKLDHELVVVFSSEINADKHPLQALRAAQKLLENSQISATLDLKICIDVGECLIVRDTQNAIQSIIGEPLSFSSLLIEDLPSRSLALTEQASRLIGNHHYSESYRRNYLYGTTSKLVVYVDPKFIESSGSTIAIPFLGRDSQLTFLNEKEAYSRHHKKSEYIFITGDAGQGKTRLIKEFLSLQSKNRLICNISFLPEAHLNHDFLDALLTNALTFIGIDRDKISQDSINYLAHYFSISQKAHISALQELVCGENISSEWSSLDAKSRMVIRGSLIAHILASLSKSTPLLLVFEDIHWANSHFYSFLDELIELDSMSMLVVLSSRNPAINKLDYPLLSKLHLEGWDNKTIAAATQLIIGNIKYQEDLLRFLNEKTLGSPLHILETFRYLKLSKELDNDKGKASFLSRIEKIDIPFILRSLVEQQVSFLNFDRREVLSLLATFGMKVQKNIFEECFKNLSINFIDIADSLERDGFITLTKSGFDECYVFSHELIQKAIYHTIIDSRKKYLHQHIFITVRRLNLKDKEEKDRILAYHAYLGGILSWAYKYNYVSGQVRKNSYDLIGANEYFQICLSCNQKISKNNCSSSKRAFILQTNIGKNLLMMSDFMGLESVLDKLKSFKNTIKLTTNELYQYTHIQSAYDWVMGNYDSVILNTETCLKSKEINDDDKISLIIKMGSVYSDTGKYRVSNSYYKKALHMLEGRSSNKVLENTLFPAHGICYSMMARNFAYMNDYKYSLLNIGNALKIAEIQSNPSSVIFILCFCAEAYIHQLKFKNASELLEKAHELSKKYKVDILVSYINVLLGYSQIMLNHHSGISIVESGVDKGLKEGRKCRISMHYYYLGKSFIAQNDIKLAKSSFLKALNYARIYKEAGYEYLILKELIKVENHPIRRTIMDYRMKFHQELLDVKETQDETKREKIYAS